MNYLAHILLSGPNADWQLGGFLGDFIKGPLPDGSRSDNRSRSELLSGELLSDEQGQPWSAGVLHGLRLHRRLDAHIDSLPAYRHCIGLLGPDFRRLGGIAMDVFFDHLLARHWSQYCGQDLSVFSADFYGQCERQMQRLPLAAAQFISRAAAFDLFRRYGERQVYRQVLKCISARLRYPTNLVASGEAVLDNYDELDVSFLALMPELIKFTAQARQIH